MNLSYLLTPNKSLYKFNDNLPDFELPLNESVRPKEDINNKNILVVESDNSLQKETQPSGKKTAEKTNCLKRERDSSCENQTKFPQKRKKCKIANGEEKIMQIDVQEEVEEIPNTREIHVQNAMKFNNGNAMLNNDFNFINNYNHLIPNVGLENATKNEKANYLLLAQKMMSQNSNFLIQYSDVLNNNKNMLSLNKN